MHTSLHEFGLETLRTQNSVAYQACLRVADELRNRRVKTFGLIPADSAVAVPPLLAQLGFALYELTQKRIACVDANLTHPAWRALLQQCPTNPLSSSALSSMFAEVSLETITLLIPTEQTSSVPLATLGQHLAPYRDRFDYCLLDLTGFEAQGEHLAAQKIVDELILVVSSRSTRESDLFRAHEIFGEHTPLRAILTEQS